MQHPSSAQRSTQAAPKQQPKQHSSSTFEQHVRAAPSSSQAALKQHVSRTRAERKQQPRITHAAPSSTQAAPNKQHPSSTHA
eukprot:10136845-Lingulodinium_polyedra.AAC.1